MDTSSSQQRDGLFNAGLIERVQAATNDRIDLNGGERKRFRSLEPDAVMLVPSSLEEWLPEGHLARSIAELVYEQLDLERFHKSHAKAKGQPPYDPRLMLRILLYGYCPGVRSSRAIERACTDMVSFRWLSAQRNFTDPDARIMKRADGSFSYNYNAQVVVDSYRQVIVAAELGQGANDYGQLAPMVEQTFQNLRRMPRQWLADTGYCSKANLEHARAIEAEHGTEFFISTDRMKHAAPIPESPRGTDPCQHDRGGQDGPETENQEGEESLRPAQIQHGTSLRTNPHPSRQTPAPPGLGESTV